MTSKEKQLKNGVIYMLPVIVGNVLPFITLPIFTRILTTEDYGVWGLAQVYAVFVNGIANFGLGIGYERNFFEHKEKKESAGLLYSVLSFILTSFVFFGILTFVFRHQLSDLIIGSPDHADILFWSYCATGMIGLKAYFLTYFKNTENAKAFAWYTIDENVLGVLFSLFLVAYLRIGVIGLIWGQLSASLIVFSLLSVKFLKILPVSFSLKSLKDCFKISLPLTVKIFFGVIGTQFDKYMIGLLNTVGGVGVYNIGQKLANVVFTIMTAIQNVYSPQVYKQMFNMGEEGKKSIGRYLTPFLYVSVLIGVLVALFSEEIIMILTPKSYHGAIDIVIILSMLYGSYFFGKQPQLIYAKKTFLSSIMTLVSIGINIAINIPFITRWGVMGAAWGTLTAGLITGIVSFFIHQHYYEIKWEYLKIGLVFSLFFGSAIAMVVMRQIEVAYIIRLVFKTVVFAFYLFLGYKFHILTKQNFLLVKSFMIPKKASAS